MKKIYVTILAVSMLMLGTAYGKWTDVVSITESVSTGALKMKIDKAQGINVWLIGENGETETEITTLLYNEKGEPYIEVSNATDKIHAFKVKYALIPDEINTVSNIDILTDRETGLNVSRDDNKYYITQTIKIPENESVSYAFDIPLYIEPSYSAGHNNEDSKFTYGSWIQKINISGMLLYNS